MHESLISSEETFRTEDCGDYYKINPEVPGMDYRQYYFKGQKNNDLPHEGHTSANAKRLSKEELKELLLSLDEIKEESENFKNKNAGSKFGMSPTFE